jgi:hypothetical protein
LAARAGTTTPDMFDVQTDPTTASNVYATADNRFFYSNDGGTTWNENDPPGTSLCVGIAVDHANNKVYVGTDKGVAFNTLAPSGAWTFGTTSSGFPIQPIVDGSGHVFVGGFGAKGHVFKSINGGVTYTDLGQVLPTDADVLGMAYDGPNTFYVTVQSQIAGNGIWRSIDSCATFTALTGLANPKFDVNRVLAVDGSHNVYFADRNNGIFVCGPSPATAFGSADPNKNLPPGNAASSVAVCGLGPDLGVYIYSSEGNNGNGNSPDQGIWRTLDGGTTWAPVTDGLRVDNRANTLGSTGNTIYAAIQAGGLWRTTTAGH